MLGDRVLGADRAGRRTAPAVPPAAPAAADRDHGRRRGHPPDPLRPRLHPRPDQDRRSACGRRRDLLSLVPNVRAPLGLRTVDGSFNNLVNFGGTTRPSSAPPTTSSRGCSIRCSATQGRRDFRPGQPGVQSSYQQTSGIVFDSQPRTISNLIVDQTANNPARATRNAYDPRRGRRSGLRLTAGSDDVAEGRRARSSPAPGLDGSFGTADDTRRVLLPERRAGRRPVGAVQRLDDVLRPVLRPRPRPRHQGRQRHGLHSAAAGRPAVRHRARARPTSWC